MEEYPSLMPQRPPQFVAKAVDQPAEMTSRQVNRHLRDLFRDAFDELGGASWLVEFATRSDSNARTFVQAIAKLLPPANDPKGQGGVIIDVPWLTNARLSYKRQEGPTGTEVLDIQVKGE